MSEKNFSEMISNAVILAILAYMLFSFFQVFGVTIASADNPGPAILSFLALIALILIAFNFIFIALGKSKFTKIVKVITIIAVIVFLVSLVVTFLIYTTLLSL